MKHTIAAAVTLALLTLSMTGCAGNAPARSGGSPAAREQSALSSGGGDTMVSIPYKQDANGFSAK